MKLILIVGLFTNFVNYLNCAKIPVDYQTNLPNESTSEFWLNNAKDFVNQQVNKKINTNKAKNIVLFLGDGLSVPTVSTARLLLGGEENSLSFEEFPHLAMSMTYCVNYQVAESASTATAYLSGVKANYDTLGVNANVVSGNCTAELDTSTHTSSIAKWAMDAGKVAGLVTTTRVTHATPAGVYAHSSSRYRENNQNVLDGNCDDSITSDMAEQLVYSEVGRNLRVILGGGRGELLDRTFIDEQGHSGRRTDGKNLINEWIEIHENMGHSEYIYNKTQLMNINATKTDYLLGLFASSHCTYNYKLDHEVEPTLTEMVEKAIDILSQHENGFFLLVEGGQIDRAHHDTQAHIALDETVEFSRAISLARQKLNEDETIIVVTADHSHTMSHAGYNKRGTSVGDVGGISGIDNKPFMTLSYANGPGYYDHVNKTSIDLKDLRIDPSTLNMSKVDSKFPATVPFESETHGGDDVAIYAIGPWSHFFEGVIEQNVIPHILAYAACIGNGYHSCVDK